MIERKLDNQIENYPIVLIPENILKNINHGIPKDRIYSHLNIYPPPKRNQPSNLPKPPLEYQNVKTEKLRLAEGSYLVITFILILSTLIGINSTNTYESPILVILGTISFQTIIAVLSGFIKIKTTYTFEKKPWPEGEFERLIQKYNDEKKLYENKLKEQIDLYQKELLKFEHDFYIKSKNACKELYYNDLKPFIIAKRYSGDVKRGKSELRFLEVALNLFGNNLFIDMAPEGLNKNDVYQPDFTFICERTNLHIDIEIDEPYTLKNHQPIHFRGSDKNRNDFFLEINWGVIRFTENQIIYSPKECCETIKSIYDSVISVKKTYNCAVGIEPTWSYEEALVLSQRKIR